jgi:hypothetical protein
MKTFLTALLIAFIAFSFHSANTGFNPHIQFTQQQAVYICKGPNSLRFHHHSNCRGLNNCTTQIYTVSVSEAKNLSRTPCQICY